MKSLGKAADVENLCSVTLRTLIETENMCCPAFEGQNNVSRHLGHSPKMRNDFYVLPDKRWMVQSANRLLFLLEEAGESDDGPWCEGEICFSSDLVSDNSVANDYSCTINMMNFDFSCQIYIVSCLTLPFPPFSLPPSFSLSLSPFPLPLLIISG